jgi:hypothetical protein
VNGRIIRKRLHVRIEHVQPSRCREDFLRRRETNDRIKHEAKVKGGETHQGLSVSEVDLYLTFSIVSVASDSCSGSLGVLWVEQCGEDAAQQEVAFQAQGQGPGR